MSPDTGPATPARAVYPKLTVRASQDVIDAAKAAYTLDAGTYRTFSAWVEAALLAAVEDTKHRHHTDELPDVGEVRLRAGRPSTTRGDQRRGGGATGHAAPATTDRGRP